MAEYFKGFYNSKSETCMQSKFSSVATTGDGLYSTVGVFLFPPVSQAVKLVHLDATAGRFKIVAFSILQKCL